MADWTYVARPPGKDPYAEILAVDPYAQILATPPPDNSLGQWAGVINNALLPYAAAGGAGAAAGAPFAGVGAIPGAAAGVAALGLTDLGTSLYNVVGGGVFGAPRMMTGSEAIRNVVRPTGVIREPQTTAQRLVGTALEGATVGGGQARALTELAPLVQSATASNAMRSLGQGAFQQAGAGAGAYAAPTLAQEYGIYDPAALTALSFGGGLLGAKSAVALESAGRTAQTAVTQAIEAATDRGPRTQAQISAAFKSATQSGLRYNPRAYGTFVNEAEAKLVEEGYDQMVPDLYSTITQVINSLRAKQGQNLTIGDLHTLRKTIGNARGNSNKNIRRLAGILNNELDDFISSPNAYSVTARRIPADVQQEFRGAITQQNLQFKSEEITRLIERAQLMQGDMASNLRSQFAAVARRPERMRRFTPAEQATITKIATSRGNIGSLIGGLNPGARQKNIVADLLHAAVGTGTAVAISNPYGLLAGAGTAALSGTANIARNAMATQGARNLAGQVRRGNVQAPIMLRKRTLLSPSAQAALNATSTPPPE
jgi:hypothetical protein